MKKIAIIAPGYKPVPAVKGGGVEQLITQILESNEVQNKLKIDVFTPYDIELEKVKYENTNLYLIKTNKIETLIEKIMNKIYNILSINNNLSFFSEKVTKSINLENYSKIIIENNMYTYEKILARKKERNVDLYFHLHNDIGKNDKPFYLSKKIIENSKKVITCSDFLKNKMNKICDRNNIVTLHNSIDFSIFKYSLKDRKNIRKIYSVEDDDYLFLYVGRISPEKGIKELIDCFIEFNISRKSKLMIVGGFSENRFCKKIKEKISKINKIICTGEIKNTDVCKYMSASDCIIIPTMCEEAFGLVAAEALSCGKELIITNSGGLTEVVCEHATIVDKSNIKGELVNAMISKYNSKTNQDSFCEKKANYIKSIESFKSENYYTNFLRIIYDGDENE